jgi:hypothetical protein
MAYVPDRSNPACPGTGQSPRALTHTSQPFSIFAQSFGASVNHFLVSLSNLVIANSAIFGIVNSVILAPVNSTILAVELSHFMILPAILQERLVIPHCYSTQPFLLHCSSILTTVLSHFFIFATVNSVIFVTMSAVFPCYSAQPFFKIVQSFSRSL